MLFDSGNIEVPTLLGTISQVSTSLSQDFYTALFQAGSESVSDLIGVAGQNYADLAGNLGSTSSLQLTVDTAAPLITNFSGPGSYTVANTLSGSTNEVSTVFLVPTLNEASITNLTALNDFLNSSPDQAKTTGPIAGDFNLSLSGLQAGVDYTLAAFDIVGNRSDAVSHIVLIA